MADKPSRALVLYGDGLARFVDQSHIHIHSLASEANCGFLSLPNAPISESEDERIVREFAHVLDAAEAYINKNGDNTKAECQNSSSVTNISERFMGMKAALITNNSSLKSFGGKLGLTVLQLSGLSEHGHSLSQVDSVTSELLKLLGFQEGKTLEPSQFDVVFLHIGDDENVNGKKDNAVENEMEFTNALVGEIMQVAQPGSEIGSRLHLSLVMNYGSVSDGDDVKLSVLISKEQSNSGLSALFPRQSYTLKGEHPRDNVRHHCPMLIAQRQYAVTRKDQAETFCFEEFIKNGGNLVIPADRFLHEVAFKLWKAPKYGA